MKATGIGLPSIRVLSNWFPSRKEDSSPARMPSQIGVTNSSVRACKSNHELAEFADAEQRASIHLSG